MSAFQIHVSFSILSRNLVFMVLNSSFYFISSIDKLLKSSFALAHSLFLSLRFLTSFFATHHCSFAFYIDIFILSSGFLYQCIFLSFILFFLTVLIFLCMSSTIVNLNSRGFPFLLLSFFYFPSLASLNISNTTSAFI